MPGMGSPSQSSPSLQPRPQIYSPYGPGSIALPSNQPTHERLTTPTRPGMRGSVGDDKRSASAPRTVPFSRSSFSNATPAPLIPPTSTIPNPRLRHTPPPPEPYGIRPPARSEVNTSNRPQIGYAAPPMSVQYPPMDRSQDLYGDPYSGPNANRFATKPYGWEKYTNGGAGSLNPSYTQSPNRPNANQKVPIPFVSKAEIASDSVISLGDDCLDGARGATIWAKWIGDEWQLSEFACRSLRT